MLKINDLQQGYEDSKKGEEEMKQRMDHSLKEELMEEFQNAKEEFHQGPCD